MKVLFTNHFGQTRTEKMEHIPRIGDTIPFFYSPYPRVKSVVWFPNEMDTSTLLPSDIDVMILVE
jgi:hypothetical protein